MAEKRWALAGCSFWIAGLAAFIIGLNLTGAVREWMTTIGTIVFLIGLGIMGAIWLKKKKAEEGSENHTT